MVLRERVLAIVTILARYFLEERNLISDTELVEELLSVGFDEEEIDAAFSWMQGLSPVSDSPTGQKPLVAYAQRIFSADEQRLLSNEARSFLIRLRTLGILDDEAQEEVIERAFQMEEDEISLKEIKVMTALSLFARSNEDWRREVDCLLGDNWGRMFN